MKKQKACPKCGHKTHKQGRCAYADDDPAAAMTEFCLCGIAKWRLPSNIQDRITRRATMKTTINHEDHREAKTFGRASQTNTEYWTIWNSYNHCCSTHISLEAAKRAARKCEKDGGHPHEIIRVTRIPYKPLPAAIAKLQE